MSGSGALTKDGAGTLILTGTNSHTGRTTVSNGTLQIGNNGTLGSLSGNVTVASGATLAISRSDAVSFGGNVSGGGELSKLGNGTTTLTGTNTYTGATTINAGTLRVNGSLASGSAVSINNTGTLGGSGTVAGAVAVNSGGTISPGNSPGILTTGSTTYAGIGNYNWQLLDATGAAGTGFDQQQINGTLTITATSSNKFNINLWTLSSIGPDVNGNASNFNSSNPHTWTLVATTGGITGFTADAFDIRTTAVNGTGRFANGLGGGTFSLAQSGNNLDLVFTPVPEPTSVFATCAALAAAGLVRRRMSKQTATA